MNVTNREMYHFNRPESFKEVWAIGNEFIVDDKFSSNMKNTTVNSDVFIKCNDINVSFNRILNRASQDNYDNLSIKDIKNLLIDSKRIIHNYSIAMRELALEEYRREHYPELPSRLSSIWVCSKSGIKYWENVFEDDYQKRELLKVSLTGNLFKTSDEFLPQFGESFLNTYKDAEKYWNPNFKEDYSRSKVEYLFKGKVRVLEKVK